MYFYNIEIFFDFIVQNKKKLLIEEDSLSIEIFQLFLFYYYDILWVRLIFCFKITFILDYVFQPLLSWDLSKKEKNYWGQIYMYSFLGYPSFSQLDTSKNPYTHYVGKLLVFAYTKLFCH